MQIFSAHYFSIDEQNFSRQIEKGDHCESRVHGSLSTSPWRDGRKVTIFLPSASTVSVLSAHLAGISSLRETSRSSVTYVVPPTRLGFSMYSTTAKVCAI